MFLRMLFFLAIILLIEVYFLQAVKTFSQDFSMSKKQIFLYTAYAFAGISILIGVTSLFYTPKHWSGFYRMFTSIFLIILLCKLIGCTFLIIDDFVRLLRWIFSLFQKQLTTVSSDSENGISRLKFFSQLAVTFTLIPAIGFMYGIFRGAYKYRIHHVKIPSKNLPQSFHGLKIIQISDIHSGSFIDNRALNKAFDIVMQQNPDLILFTGDLVNNTVTETVGFESVYARLKAPLGVFSVLGNHDYGDYMEWESKEAKSENLQKLKDLQEKVGWRLLINEHVIIEKNGHKIALLGIENWGGNLRFPKYGKLNEAHKGTELYPFKILMSHDPSHWDKQVRLEYSDIDLTLSGHTHGMQFGIEIPGFKWSPVQYLYKQWAGLYKNKNQFLYVNRGLGFLGYPGRIGIWPEITVIELQRT